MILDAAIALAFAVVGGALGYPLGRKVAGNRAVALGLMAAALLTTAAGVAVALFSGDRTIAMAALGLGFGLLEGVRLASGGVFSALGGKGERGH